MKTLSLAIAGLTMLVVETATAQEVYSPNPGYRCYPAPPIHVASPHHASTVAESYARGHADVVRARAQYNLLSSQAMLNLAEARRREVENRLMRTEAYFQMREINKKYRRTDRTTGSVQQSVAKQESRSGILATVSSRKSSVATMERIWTDSTGQFTVEAVFAGLANGVVRLKTPEGRTIQTPLEHLSEEDQEYVNNRRRNQT